MLLPISGHSLLLSLDLSVLLSPDTHPDLLFSAAAPDESTTPARGLNQLQSQIEDTAATDKTAVVTSKSKFPKAIIKMAEVVIELSDPASSLYSGAKKIVDGTADEDIVLAVQNEFESWNIAPSAGLEITSEDNDREVNQRDANGHVVRMEEKCTDCFQGDMKPVPSLLMLLTATVVLLTACHTPSVVVEITAFTSIFCVLLLNINRLTELHPYAC